MPDVGMPLAFRAARLEPRRGDEERTPPCRMAMMPAHMVAAVTPVVTAGPHGPNARTVRMTPDVTRFLGALRTGHGVAIRHEAGFNRGCG
ncbi:MAG: hypothetical protein JWM36_1263 [Hyphomicrobiales bacterium]|nr:hypothetical protein [Hyphomicrobiales bacterium]